MFQMRDNNRNTALGYSTQIMRIIKFWGVTIPPVPLISPTTAQEFNKATLTHMGYRQDKQRQCLYFKEKGSNSRVYNFDVPFEQIYVDEEPIDADTPDIDQEHQPEDIPVDANTGWGAWEPQRWYPTDYQPEPLIPP